MNKIGEQAGVRISIFLLLAANLAYAAPARQDRPEVPAKAAPSTPLSAAAQAPAATAGPAPSQQASPSQTEPDHAAAYYHFVLARRYEELAGMQNRSDLIDRAIAEYQAALVADPGSLFVKTQLAELYYRISRVGDAVREAEAVLQANPDEVDAHRLLASIYLHSLGESEAAASSEATLHKAITQFEAVTRLDPADTDSLVALGRLYRLTNQSSKAEETFRKAIGTDPGSRPALTYLAQLYLDQGDYSDAITTLEKIPAGDMDPAALVMMGQAYMQNRDYDKAVAAYTQALQQDPDNQELHRYHAEALMAAGKTSDARTELQKILRTDPNDAQAWLRLGHLDRVEGKFDEAREELSKAKNLQSDNAEITYEQVLLEETAGNDEKAETLIEGLLKESQKPDGNYTLGEAANRAAFLERLGMIYRNQEKYDEALKTFRQILDLGPTQTPHGEALMIDTLRLARRPTQAMDEANAAVAKYPKDRQLAMLRASLLGEQGKPDEAIAALNGLLAGGPSDFEVLINIAQVNSQAKRYSDAEAAAQKALSVSNKPDDQENAHFILGSVYEREKRYDLAETEFKKVLASDPLRGDAANYLGYMLADRGVRLEESVKYIQQALQSDPNNGAYLDSLGWAYLKMNRPDLAERPLERAAHLISNDPTILEHLGNVDLALGKPQAAEQEWERALKEWPQAVGSDFDADQAASLQKKLDDLRFRMAKGKPPKSEDSSRP
jgi:tetratricopeptide (TPR) repeat protein